MNPQEFAMLDAQAHQYYDQTHPPTTAAAKPQAKGNLFTHLLPTIGGTAGGIGGGALGGAAAGTVILPGIGTVAGGLLGALLGGAAGGAAGKVAENTAEHQALGNGVFKEAAINGILSAGPLRLAKFGYGTLRGLSTVGREGAPVVQALEGARGIPIKDVSTTATGKAGAVLPTAPTTTPTTQSLDPTDFAARFKPGAQQLTKQLPGVTNTFMQTGTHDPLTLISQHLATNATKGETRQIVNGLFPQGLDNNARNVLIKKLQTINSPEEVNQLLDQTHQAITNVPSGAIAPKAIKVNFADGTTNSSVLPAKPQALIQNIVPGEKITLADAINGAAQKANKPMLQGLGKDLVTQGEAAQGRVAGVSAGSKAAGKELTPQDTSAMLQTLQREGIKTGNANNTLRDIQDKLTQYGQGIGEHFTNNNAPLKPNDVGGLASQYMKGLKTSDPTINKQAQILATDLKNNVRDTKGLWEFRKNLDSMIPDAKQGADNTGAAKLIALKNMRQFITKQLGNVPGAANYHNLSEIKPFISSEAKRLNNPGGGIIGRVAASGPVQKAEQVFGKGVAKVGNTIGGTADAASSAIPGLTPGAIAGRTVPFGALSAIGSSMAQPAGATDPSQPQQPQDLTSALMGAQGLGQDAQSQQPTSPNPYSQENLMADIQRDPTHAANYISTYESLDKIFNPPANTTKSLNSTQQQQAFNAQSGLDSLNEIANVLQQNPNAAKESNIPGGGLLASVTGTGSYQAAINNAVDVIGRLRSGGAIGQEEERNFKKMLPAFNDNQQTINYKLQQLATLFQKFADPQASQPGSSDLTSALMQAGYGQ